MFINAYLIFTSDMSSAKSVVELPIKLNLNVPWSPLVVSIVCISLIGSLAHHSTLYADIEFPPVDEGDAHAMSISRMGNSCAFSVEATTLRGAVGDCFATPYVGDASLKVLYPTLFLALMRT